jgi:Bestrophin, RFP-TM, chloride channel
MEGTTWIFCLTQTICLSGERLLSSPIPLFYSRHTARFLTFWLVLMPFALWEPFKDSWNHAGVIPATALISIFLFGIEELATQMEEPFTILPMQSFCDKIGNWCNEIVSWTPGDNGMPVETAKERHSNIVILDGLALPANEVEMEPVNERAVNGQAVNGDAVVHGESIGEDDELSTPERKRKGLLSFGFSQYK